RKKAESLGVKMNIAVVDAGANLKAFVRMDGAWLGSVDIAQKKARTARYFDMPTGEIGKLSQPGGSLYQIEVSNNGLITFPGGASVATVANDRAVAPGGAEALSGAPAGRTLRPSDSRRKERRGGARKAFPALLFDAVQGRRSGPSGQRPARGDCPEGLRRPEL